MLKKRVLSTELQFKAIEELHEDPKRIAQDFQHIKDWLNKQPHLHFDYDEELWTCFGRGCKWSLRRMKEKIDNFCSIRTLAPEYFANRDPFSTQIQNTLKLSIVVPLPNSDGPNGPRILFYDFSKIQLALKHVPITTIGKIFFMALEILMLEDDDLTGSGLVIIGDFKDLSLSVSSQFEPGLTMTYIKALFNAYPIRLKRYIALNVNSIFDITYTMCKPLLSEKMKKRILVFNEKEIDKVYHEIDRSLLPYEYGGSNGSLTDAANKWKSKVESYREWFLDDSKCKSNETLRQDESKCAFDFNTEGSFRKLSID